MSTERKSCPRCASPGSKVEQITLDNQVQPQRLKSLADASAGAAGFRYCASPECEVVYFGIDPVACELVTLDEVKQTPFDKSLSPAAVAADEPSKHAEQLVCFCFQHRVGELDAEVARSGDSVVPAEIAEKCKQGLDRCEQLNPKGSCCLGQVRRVVNNAKAKAAASGGAVVDSGPRCSTDEAAHDCCAPKQGGDKAIAGAPGAARFAQGDTPSAEQDFDATGPRDRSGRVALGAAGGAIVAAVLASACCWLPLVLVLAGASAVGAGQLFETYRPIFLGITALMLGAGFYYAYFRKPSCAPGSACATPNKRLQRFTRSSLWIATSFTIAMAAFPSYVGQIWEFVDARAAAAEAPTPAAPVEAAAIPGVQKLALEGMSCEGCAVHIRHSLEKVPGVKEAKVDYETSEATVTAKDPKTPPALKELIAAVAASGYLAHPIK